MKFMNFDIQKNFFKLIEKRDASAPRFSKQSMNEWFDLRKTSKVSGSTMNSAFGLDII